MKNSIFLVTLVAAVFSCKQARKVQYSGYIVGGTNDIVSVTPENQSSIPSRALNASVLLATHTSDGKIKFCSGVLIAADPATGKFRVLSNHHCFAQSAGENDVSPKLLPEACTSTHIYFSLTKDSAADSSFSTCVPGSLRTHFDADVAVFSLVEPPPADATPLGLWTGPDPAPAGRKALIVHYPDISDNLVPMLSERARLPAASVTLEDCKTSGVFDQGQWHLDHSLPFGIQHTCDLVHGSSGSPLIDAETLSIIGINWGGIKIKVNTVVQTYNVATRARYIAAFLGNDIKALNDPVQISIDPGAVAGNGSTPNVDEEKNKKDLASAARKAACGVVGYSDSENSWLLKFFLLIPLLLLLFMRRRRPGS